MVLQFLLCRKGKAEGAHEIFYAERDNACCCLIQKQDSQIAIPTHSNGYNHCFPRSPRFSPSAVKGDPLQRS